MIASSDASRADAPVNSQSRVDAHVQVITYWHCLQPRFCYVLSSTRPAERTASIWPSIGQRNYLDVGIRPLCLARLFISPFRPAHLIFRSLSCPLSKVSRRHRCFLLPPKPIMSSSPSASSLLPNAVRIRAMPPRPLPNLALSG
jgi:hypothetical protein